MGENQNGGAGSTENTPELVEVEMDGKKVKIEKGAEVFLMKDKDYRQKTAALAEEKRSLLAEKESLKNKIEAAENLSSMLGSNPQAADVLALLAEGKTKEAAKLLAEDNDDTSDVEKLRKELNEVKNRLNSKLVGDTEAAKRTQQFAEAQRIIKERFGKDINEAYPKMVELAQKSPNPHVPWFIATSFDDLLEEAKKQAKEEGKKEALEELTSKLDNTPPMSSGYGASGKGGHKSTYDAASAVYNKLREKKLRESGSS